MANSIERSSFPRNLRYYSKLGATGRVLGSPLSRRRLLLTSNPRPRLTIFGRARDRKIAREPFLIYGRNGQHFSGTLAGGPSHNSEIEARFYVEFKGILPMRATRIDGTLPDESSPHLFCMETKFSLFALLLPIQSFFSLLLLFSSPSLQGVLSSLLYTFQFPSFKVRVAIKLALNLLLHSLSPDAADSLWVSATHGNFFLGFCSTLKFPR